MKFALGACSVMKSVNLLTRAYKYSRPALAHPQPQLVRQSAPYPHDLLNTADHHYHMSKNPFRHQRSPRKHQFSWSCFGRQINIISVYLDGTRVTHRGITGLVSDNRKVHRLSYIWKITASVVAKTVAVAIFPEYLGLVTNQLREGR